ncbi:type VI secretion system Vgr family protein [Massilia terrae]|uniref:Type VI secretion system tip protein VgrG n=1 Tax=Massilia terrae TaxID=1811224 RepID=A0ABT2CW34_9BURK|nr:type VI secretion system Vgr family protein [Massilia terrae]MCS0658182.1 type VI secretion system tip protein VgrG [Massilia terrae]
MSQLTDDITAALVQFSGTTRLYSLSVGDGDGASGDLLVEAFLARDAVNEVGVRDLIVLSTSTWVDLDALLGQTATLETSLADGTCTVFAGDICEAAMLGSDGRFARYRLRVSPWIWRLGQVRNSRVWQDKAVIHIVDDVFAPYRPLARWRWSGEAVTFMSDALPRSYCCQYRESDFDFVSRLLAEEGLSWRFEDGSEGSCMVLFADSSHPDATPEDACSASGGGIRYHGARAVEQRDTVQSLAAQRRLHASLATVLSYDYKAKRIVATQSPTRIAGMPALEAFDVPGQYAYPNAVQARRYADLRMQGMEARGQLWRGRSTVRTLRAGTRVTVTEAPLQQLGDDASFAILGVTSVGVNNLPPSAAHALTELFGPIPELLEECSRDVEPEDFELVIAQAIQSGYANCFDAVHAELTWGPQTQHPKPTALGSQGAIVVGADGGDEPSGADELCCDRLGRVRIRYHWQDSGDATCWVRVAQRSAGGGMGSQFLPRIGQEVLVQFVENDIDRPVIVGALYNGQGEGGIGPTPGGMDRTASNDLLFEKAHDHACSAQGNLAGGNSPVWHGASAGSDGHRNGGAQWGVRSKEFGGHGYNQLLFDDTDAQGRLQLKTTYAATELNLGHLVHCADNYRGSFRGLGAELRTDSCGAVRAGRGLLVSSYKISHNATARDPAGENGACVGMLRQAAALAESFHGAALTHQTVGLAMHAGAAKANASVISDETAPLKSLLAAASGMVSNDGAVSSSGQLPHSSEAIIAISAKDGFGANAGQSMQLANGETVALMSGGDTQFVTGGQMRVHAGQAIGVLAGAVKAGEGGVGLQLIAAKDAIDIQAQSDELKIQARDEIKVISANSHIDWAAAKRISLSTAGGANITIEGGNVTVQCPGKITINAGKKSLAGPERVAYPMPALPRTICVACLRKALAAGAAFTMVE